MLAGLKYVAADNVRHPLVIELNIALEAMAYLNR